LTGHVLCTGPAARGARTCQRSGHGKHRRRGQPEEHACCGEQPHRIARLHQRTGRDRDGGADGTRQRTGLSNERGGPASTNPAIGQCARQRSGHGIDAVDRRADAGHLRHGETARFHQERRQPRDDEVERIVDGEMPERRAPELPPTKDGGIGDRQRRFLWGPVEGPFARHHEPGPQPQDGDDPEPDEHGAPAETRHRQAAEKCPEHRADALTGADEPIGTPALVFGCLSRQDQLVAGKHHALAKSEDQPQYEDRGKANGGTGHRGCHAPQHQAGGENDSDVETVNQPACKQLCRGIDPEERREQYADLRGREREFVLQQRRCSREVGAIDVVEQHRQPEHQNHRIG
jgi:hypothetical protein